MNLVKLTRHYYELSSLFDGHVFERSDVWALDVNHAISLLRRRFLAEPHPRHAEFGIYVIQMADNEVAIDEFVAELDTSLRSKAGAP